MSTCSIRSLLTVVCWCVYCQWRQWTADRPQMIEWVRHAGKWDFSQTCRQDNLSLAKFHHVPFWSSFCYWVVQILHNIVLRYHLQLKSFEKGTHQTEIWTFSFLVSGFLFKANNNVLALCTMVVVVDLSSSITAILTFSPSQALTMALLQGSFNGLS